MTTDKNQENTLLMEKERVICRKVAGTNEAPHNQRAQALLALNEGLSQAQAGERAGLTLGQVKYCLSKFRQQRLDFFPEHLQGRPAPAETSVGPEAKPVIQPESTGSSEVQPKAKPKTQPEPKKAVEVAEDTQPAKTDEKKDKKPEKVKAKKKKAKKSDKKKKKKDTKKKGSKKVKKGKKKRKAKKSKM